MSIRILSAVVLVLAATACNDQPKKRSAAAPAEDWKAVADACVKAKGRFDEEKKECIFDGPQAPLPVPTGKPDPTTFASQVECESAGFAWTNGLCQAAPTIGACAPGTAQDSGGTNCVAQVQGADLGANCFGSAGGNYQEMIACLMSRYRTARQQIGDGNGFGGGDPSPFFSQMDQRFNQLNPPNGTSGIPGDACGSLGFLRTGMSILTQFMANNGGGTLGGGDSLNTMVNAIAARHGCPTN